MLREAIERAAHSTVPDSPVYLFLPRLRPPTGTDAIPEEWLKFAPAPRPLKGGERWNVYLSYRSANRAWVLNLYDVLRRYRPRRVPPSFFLRRATRTSEVALSSSQAGMLVWSQATRDSPWVRKEYQVMERQATKRPEFRFVPVKLDAAELPGLCRQPHLHRFPHVPRQSERRRAAAAAPRGRGAPAGPRG